MALPAAGDIRQTQAGLSVRIVNGIDPLGNAAAMVLDEAGADQYLTILPVAELVPEAVTFRATTTWGNVLIECPTDGNRRQRCLWSQAAVDAYLAQNPAP